jgi:hypothetical protein
MGKACSVSNDKISLLKVCATDELGLASMIFLIFLNDRIFMLLG